MSPMYAYVAGTMTENMRVISQDSAEPGAQELYVFTWTTEQPTEPGWYWAMERGEIRMYRFDGKYVNDGNDGETSFDLEAARENWEITHWLGPLPVPHPPG